MSTIHRETHKYRRSDAYPCAMFGCSEPSEWVETRTVTPNRGAASLGFYGYCHEHAPEHLRDAPDALARLRELRDLPARIPELRRAAVNELLAQGWSRQQIAAELGISRQSVYEWGR